MAPGPASHGMVWNLDCRRELSASGSPVRRVLFFYFFFFLFSFLSGVNRMVYLPPFNVIQSTLFDLGVSPIGELGGNPFCLGLKNETRSANM
ncbi:hypothetical protein BDV32DRAFT_129022 [Aspergillus pseudonomiae]|nr:hypothetical protein BDV32DRAFT_129022 [Aspergillus pseudonomiae]